MAVTNLATVLLSLNQTHQINEVFTDLFGTPASAPSGTTKFSSDSPNIASVTTGGLITALALGVTQVTVNKGSAIGYIKVVVQATTFPTTIMIPS